MPEHMQKSVRKSRWPKIVLVGSLTLNLLLIGLIVGTIVRVGPHSRHDRGDRLIPYILALPNSDRQAMRTEFEHKIEKRRSDRRRSSGARLDELLTVLRSQTFDPDKLRSIFEERVDWHWRQLHEGRDALILRISGLSEEERLLYADRLERRLQRSRRNK